MTSIIDTAIAALEALPEDMQERVVNTLIALTNTSTIE